MTAESHDPTGRRGPAPRGYSPVASWIISRDTAAEMTRRFGEDRYLQALAYVGDTLQREMERR
jgi:hypothetical protein